MPQIIGHRAYRGKYPENTLLAYDKAYEAGVDMIETDIQMSDDGVVVINHDMDTGRMYDRSMSIADTEWRKLQKLRLASHPDIGMLSLRDALLWLMKHDNVKLLLDVKATNKRLILVRAVDEMLSLVDDLDYWRSRILFGLWQLDWFEYGVSTTILRGFPLVYIGLSLDQAAEFLDYSETLAHPDYRLHAVSLHHVATWAPEFHAEWQRFQRSGIQLFLWTVNSALDTKYLAHVPVAGVVTDVPVDMSHDTKKWPRKDSPLTPPSIMTREGLRFHFFLAVYRVARALTTSSWAKRPIFGPYSVNLICIILLRRIHFI
ncbi:AFL096Cp [Eremothecium gossypii ATCC 10895]|uniref:AFL096Cp n=1 Tax=Eremothecium gossypii (strain ATCC 10895 / CBS 109.51 / FGSC 9923 / NRRL Y-1056) TaxID=284811 RepID=Q755B9_EREGS|nr:AFL096Cp [Eremothecium gossypii ATCC 10895]AAS53278.1 AFL096Cp [Eremothecium gossypii ATCC 10895]